MPFILKIKYIFLQRIAYLFIKMSNKIIKIENIIWDWNGTLLNDIAICIEAMNLLLIERNLPLLSIKKYKSIFTFPVKTYYEKLGFDFTIENFEVPANQFIKNYTKLLPKAALFNKSEKTLQLIKQKGIKQFV